MPFVAQSDLHVPALPEAVYDVLADHAAWSSWMPKSFRPVGSSPGTLTVGSRFRVRIFDGPPSALRVTIGDRGRQLTWTGGLRGALHADHHFYFEPENGGTRVVSAERWSGALGSIAKPIVEPLATRVGREMLDGLARAVAKRS